MRGFIKNYGLTVAMLLGVAAGGLCGVFAPETAGMLKPFGEVFLNLLFVMVIPMVFFSISLSFYRLRSGGRLGRLLGGTLAAFAVIWLVAGLSAWLGVRVSGPLVCPGEAVPTSPAAFSGRAEAFVSAFSVPDFPQLFSKFSILPLILFSALVGAGLSAAGDKGRPAAALLESCNEGIIKAMDILMYAAPIGLGCYFAATAASVGPSILGGYIKIFVLYSVLAALMFFILNPALVLLARGPRGLMGFWRHILPPSLTALATASSSVAMPGNIEASVRTGVDDSVAGAVVPLSTNLLKAGSVAGAVLKVCFLLLFCGMDPLGAPACVGIAILAAVVSGAVANGGVTGDLLICSLLGADPSLAGVVMIIGTIIDIPATLVNSQSNVVAAVLADKFSGK